MPTKKKAMVPKLTPLQDYEPFVAEGLPQFVRRVPDPVFLVTPVSSEAVTATVRISLGDDPSPVVKVRSLSLVIPVRTHDIDGTQGVTLGRGDGCDLQLPFPSISRVHALVTQVNGEYFLTDKGSKNGTLINGEMLEPNRAYPLPDDALVMFADLEVTFLLPETLYNELVRQCA